MSTALPQSAEPPIAGTLEQVTLTRVTRRLVPFLFLVFLICLLDRLNVGFAALQMNQALGFSPAVYGFGAGIFFLGYVLFEVPSNLILARVGARVWIARIMITWGLLAAAMMFVRGPASFYALRFLLGVAEAGFAPGWVYYLGEWFPESQRARAFGKVSMAIPLSGVVGGPLSGALLGLSGRLGLAGWQWLFLLEGLPAVALGFVVLGYLTDSPQKASWLSAVERTWLTQRLSEERERCRERHGLSLRQALFNGTVWQLGVLHFLCFTFGTYVLGLWLPQIIRGFSEFSDFKIGLVSAVPNLAGAVSMGLVGAHSDRTGERLLYIAAAALIATFAFLASAYLHSPWPIVLALSIAMVGLRSATGPFWVLPSTFLTGSAAAGGIALINSISNLSGLVGPSVIGLLREASGSFQSGMLLLALVTLAGALLAVHLRRAPVLFRSGHAGIKIASAAH